MSLIKCPECCNDISDKATFCPKCGYPPQEQDDRIRRTITATVRIEAKKREGKKYFGTGFIVGNGSFVVAAFHVVKDAQEVRAIRYHQPRESPQNEPEEILADSWTKGAYLVGIKKDAPDPVCTDGRLLLKAPHTGAEVVWSIDISVLHLTAPFRATLPLEFDSEYARIGEDVLFVGYPGGGVNFKTDYEHFYPLPLTSKATVAFTTKYGIPPTEEFYYWLDRPSFPGNSGGPVLRVKTGKVVGVISATPFMPKRIQTKTGFLDVEIPDGYSVAFGTVMLTESLAHATRSESWKQGVK
ncbi:MAG: trypsin-like peptidase domain-containing protein [Verrucomicrobiota bacterium]|jgi:S1-C subfamily serine protease